jgi:hypothetical protein
MGETQLTVPMVCFSTCPPKRLDGFMGLCYHILSVDRHSDGLMIGHGRLYRLLFA